MIRFACPSCETKISVPARNAGKKGRCPGCKGVIRVPASRAKEPQARPSPARPAPPQSPVGSLASLAEDDYTPPADDPLLSGLDDDVDWGLLGGAVAEDAKREHNPVARCRSCQGPLQAGWNTCPACGAMLQGQRRAVSRPVATRTPPPPPPPGVQRGVPKAPGIIARARAIDLTAIGRPLTIGLAVLIVIGGIVALKNDLANKHPNNPHIWGYILLATALIQGISLLIRANGPNLGFTRVICVSWGSFLAAFFGIAMLVFLWKVLVHDGPVNSGYVTIVSAIQLVLIALGTALLKYGMGPKKGGVFETVMLVVVLTLIFGSILFLSVITGHMPRIPGM